MAVGFVEKNVYSSEFYLIIIIIIALIISIIFFIKKLNQTPKQILKTLLTSFLISFGIYVLFSLFISFNIICKIGTKCPTFFDMFINYWAIGAGIFLVMIFIYYLVKFIKK